jgi:3-oxoacyl-[acyl-carrier-protein] synthase II
MAERGDANEENAACRAHLDSEKSSDYEKRIMNQERRVVITGIGLLSPLGNELSTFWDNLSHGRSGIRRITLLDPTPYPCQIAGEVDFEPKEFFKEPKDARRADRYTQLAVAGAKKAVLDAGLTADGPGIDPTRVGVMVGSGIGGLGTFEESHTVLIQKSPSRVSPFTIPMMISNIGSGIISMELGFQGPNMVIVTACATSNHNIGEAWRIIKFGDADAMVAGGAEASVLPMGLAGFANMKALSTRNDEPQRASRPFDTDRDGFVMGEGAGVVVLEELEHAKKRGAKIYAELIGYGVSGDAYHLSAPHPEGEGAARAMAMSMKHARVQPSDIQYLNAHATSTGLGDIAETKAIKRALGDYAKNGLLVSSTKSMTGHLLGAAGGVELTAAIMAMQHGLVPPTINLENLDPACDLDYVPNKAREAKVDIAMSNSFGFGGHNATVIVKRFS